MQEKVRFTGSIELRDNVPRCVFGALNFVAFQPCDCTMRAVCLTGYLKHAHPNHERTSFKGQRYFTVARYAHTQQTAFSSGNTRVSNPVLSPRFHV